MKIPTHPTQRETEVSKMRAYAMRHHDSILEPMSGQSWVMKAATVESRAPTYVFNSFIHMRAWLKSDQARRVAQLNEMNAETV